MKNILRKIKRKLIQPEPAPKADRRTSEIMSILDKGHGHARSVVEKKPVDAEGRPLPWFTYPAIEYLSQLDLRNYTILEWGIGNSSLFFSGRCKEIFSIEHNEDWFNLIKNNLPGNAHPFLVTEDEYLQKPKELNTQFDLIIVDGIQREGCLKVATEILAANGIIIFDNSDRNPELCERLRVQNMLQVDFHGFGPINFYTWTTSVFFKRENHVNPLTNQPLISKGGGY